ncbi:hypothetical protein [Streptomyces sp. SID8352]|uniref:hypothetical protein n=1 Tax=Streptomyces sp. SID8352 TaxID=2690338 RepID=UPI00136BA167|nr:hypothetical protein [Streptomyces sp. SID8352]MYU20946.1 hypothetical protein [Streptomyces sp. SID8352]
MSVDSGISKPFGLVKVWTGAARFAALLLLGVSYAAYLFQTFPIPSTQDDLVGALRSDRHPVVEVGYDDRGVNLFWETAPLVYRELHTHVPGALHGSEDVAAVKEAIAAKAGTRVTDLRFRDRQERYEPGGLAVLLPATYPLFLRSAVLIWAVFSVGVALLIAAYALPRRYMRVKNRGVWFTICLTTGVGFFTYLWLERCVAPDAGESPELKPRYAWAASLATAVILAVGGWALVHTMWWMQA